MCSLCGCWLRWAPGKQSCPPPVLLPWRGVPNQAQEPKSSTPALPVALPGSTVCLSVWGVCLSVGLQLLWLPLRGLECSSGLRGGCAVPPALQGCAPPSPHPQLLPWGGPWGQGVPGQGWRWRSWGQAGSTDPSLAGAGGAAAPPVWLLQLL